MQSLVSTSWLAEHLGAPDLLVLDASNHLPTAARDAGAEFAAGHIPGARFLGVGSLVDKSSPVPAAVPTPAQFASRMAELGIARGSHVVLYDDSAVKTSARSWFIFRLHGVEDVAILDGGLTKWRAEGRPIDGGPIEGRPIEGGPIEGGPIEGGKAQAAPTAQEPAPSSPVHASLEVRSKAEMLAISVSGAEQVVDARDAQRFAGETADFRADVAPGHVPGALNLPYDRVMNDDGTYKDTAAIRAAFDEAGLNLDRPIVTMCGGGVTAAVLLFALHLAGKEDVALYDGSWAEWGADPAMPKAMGAAAVG